MINQNDGKKQGQRLYSYIFFGISSIILLSLTISLIIVAQEYKYYMNFPISNSIVVSRMANYVIGTSCISVILSFLSILFTTSPKFTRLSSPDFIDKNKKNNIKESKKKFLIFFGMGLIQLLIIGISMVFLGNATISGYIGLMEYQFQLSFTIYHFIAFTIPSLLCLITFQFKLSYFLPRKTSIPWLAGILALILTLLIIFTLEKVSWEKSCLVFILVEIEFLCLVFILFLLYGYWAEPQNPTYNLNDIHGKLRIKGRNLIRILIRRDFLQKIFRGVSTFSLIPVICHVIAPMITVFLPVAYSIFFLLGIPSVDVMQAAINLHHETLFGLIIFSLIAVIYFLGTGILLFSVITMAKERKKGESSLVQHGIYKRIRHPQNLAISLIIFSVFVINDRAVFHELKIGHIISWGFFTLFLQLESLIEEKQMLMQFPDQYWAYIHTTGFFHPRISTPKPIPSRLLESESRYFRKRIILSVVSFILFYLIIFVVVKILKINNVELLKFINPLGEGGGMRPDTHIINEILVVLVPIGIWVVSFIITIVNYQKEKKNQKRSELKNNGKIGKKLLSISRIILFWFFVLFLLIEGFIVVVIVDNYRSWLVRN